MGCQRGKNDRHPRFWPSGMVTARCTEMETEKGAGLPGRGVCRKAHPGSDV